MFAKEGEQGSIEATATMVKSEFRFFEMQEKVSGGNAVELDHAPFGEAPEGLNAIDMGFSIRELVLGVVDSQVFGVANVHESIVATPAIGVNDTFQADLAANDSLQGDFLGIGNNFSEDLTVAFEDSKDDCLATSTSSSFATHSFGTEVRFINFDLSQVRCLSLTLLTDTVTNLQKDIVDPSHREARKNRGVGGCQVHGKTLDELPKLGLTDF